MRWLARFFSIKPSLKLFWKAIKGRGKIERIEKIYQKRPGRSTSGNDTEGKNKGRRMEQRRCRRRERENLVRDAEISLEEIRKVIKKLKKREG